MAQKTRKAFAKRFKISASGKVLHRKANHRHLLRNKSQKQKRSMRQDQGLAVGQAKQVKSALPHA